MRYYKQNNANFYSDLYQFAGQYQNFMARDQNLAASDKTPRSAPRSTYAFLPNGWKMFKRATATFDVSRIAYHYTRLPQHQVLRRASVRCRAPSRLYVVQCHRLSNLYVDVLLTRERPPAPPHQQHGCKRRGDGDGIGNRIPEIAIAMHNRKPLNELDQGAE